MRRTVRHLSKQNVVARLPEQTLLGRVHGRSVGAVEGPRKRGALHQGNRAGVSVGHDRAGFPAGPLTPDAALRDEKRLLGGVNVARKSGFLLGGRKVLEGLVRQGASDEGGHQHGLLFPRVYPPAAAACAVLSVQQEPRQA